jgi:hypothetical protein
MVLGILRKTLKECKKRIFKQTHGGDEMSDMALLRGAEPRQILHNVIEKKTAAIMTYLSQGKWHALKVMPNRLGANRFDIEIATTCSQTAVKEAKRTINIRVNQPVGISLKYGYGKFIFDTTVVAIEPPSDTAENERISLALPDRIEFVQRRSYFRVNVPQALKVNVVFWLRRRTTKTPQELPLQTQDTEAGQVLPENYWQGRLVDLSAGGAQIVVDAGQKPDLRKGQFIGLRFTPMPYEIPLMFNAQIRNILPTVDEKGICIGLQIVGLEASAEGREILQRLCNVVEHYYQINQSGAKQQDMRNSCSATSRKTGTQLIET